jgi:hypothetical protein
MDLVMLKKFLLGTIAFCSLSFSSSVVEFLTSVQNIITDYERTGKAEQCPILYTKIYKYYKYGRLYASYGLEDAAQKMLKQVQCYIAEINCNPTLYFKRNLARKTYEQLYKKNPILLAKLEPSYNAYADWWINKILKKKDDYLTYSNLEIQIKENFFDNWIVFLKRMPRPLYFKISKYPTNGDKFILNLLTSSYKFGYIKKIFFYGDRYSYKTYLDSGLIQPKIFEFKNYEKCSKYNFILVF